ncbi:hypothetical protein ACTHGU_08505 [Chitinophagaceae bacterium MMS25-I14]
MFYYTDTIPKGSVAGFLLRVTFIVYIVVGIIGVLHHEPWRDEAQSWLVAGQTGFVPLLKKLPSEGHPPLWYFILMPFARMGAPYIIQNFISLAITAAGVAILLFKTRLPVLMRILFALSYLLWYQYAIIARNYCLVVFFVMLLISLYPTRFQRPWIYALAVVGLFNSHILMFSFSFGLMLLFGIEARQQKTNRRELYSAFVLMLAGGGYLLPYLAFKGMHNPYGYYIRNHLSPVIHAFTDAIFVYYELTIAAFLWLAALVIALRKTWQLLFLLLAGCAAPCFIFAYKYAGYTWHHALLWIIIVAVIALIPFYKSADKYHHFHANLIRCLFLPVMAFHCYVAVRAYNTDYQGEFSGGKSAALFLLQHQPLPGLLITQNNKAISLLPYLPRNTKLYHPDCQRSISYVVYDSCNFFSKNDNYPDSMMIAALQQLPSIDTNTIFISDAPVTPSVLAGYWSLLYHSPGTSIQGMENYYIYRYDHK